MLILTMDGAMILLRQVAKVVIAKGTPGIRMENGRLSACIHMDTRDRDIVGYVADARNTLLSR